MIERAIKDDTPLSQILIIILICSIGEILYKSATRNKRFSKDIPSSNDLREKVIIKGKNGTFSEEENNEKKETHHENKYEFH